MAGDNKYKRLWEEPEKNKETKPNQVVWIVGIVVIAIVLFLIIQPREQKSEDKRSHAEAVEIFLEAWRDWNVRGIESVIAKDFYATNTLWDRDKSFDWLQQHRPVSWDLGDGDSSYGMMSVDIVTQDDEVIDLLFFFDLYTDGWRLSGFRAD